METIKKIIKSRIFFALILLGLIIAAYGILAPNLGFSWDGWPFIWIFKTYGGEGLTRYFSTNRPVWGWLYQITTPIIGDNPFGWQVFAIASRWLSGLALYVFLNKLWPESKEKIAWITILFVLYPGFSQHSIAIVYAHFYLVLAMVFLSYWSMLKWLENGKYKWIFFGISLLLAAYSTFATEYFFGLELLRPVVIWLVIRKNTSGIKSQIRKALKIWWPYAVLIAAYLVWRIFILTFFLYQPDLGMGSGETNNSSIFSLIPLILMDSVQAGVIAWFYPIKALLTISLDSLTAKLNIFLAVGGAAALGIYFGIASNKESPSFKKSLEGILLGILAVFLGGLPIWIAGLNFDFSFPASRFSLPMMFGSSLLITSALFLIRQKYLRIPLLAIIAGLAIGIQFFYMTEFRQEWKYQQSFFQQLTWRAPSIEPGTIILSIEVDQFFSTDNSLTAPLNWIYADGNKSLNMDYLLAYIELRTQENKSLDGLGPNQDIQVDYLAAEFNGSSDQALVLYYEPPGCLRIMSPIYDEHFPMVSSYIKDNLYLSRPETLISSQQGAELPAEIFTIGENTSTWCYYFEKADLARQMGDWDAIVALAKPAFSLDDSPNRATERIPFIEAYAMTGDFEKALEQQYRVLEINPFSQSMLCDLWQRVAEQREHQIIDMMVEETCYE